MPKVNKEIYYERAKERYRSSKWSILPFKEPLMKLAVSDYMTYKSMGGKKVDTALEKEVKSRYNGEQLNFLDVIPNGNNREIYFRG